MSYGLGRLQSLSAVLSRLLEARGYLEGQLADLEQRVGEVDALAARVKQRRDATLVSLLVDDLGKVTNLAPDERARIALQQLSPVERLRLIAEQVSECRQGDRGAEVAKLVRGLAA